MNHGVRWRRRMRSTTLARQCVSIILIAALLAPPAHAAPTAPQLSSLPGAAYTLYLDFSGFTWNSAWGTGPVPGVVPAYDIDGDKTTFTATESMNIQEMWSRVAENYAPFSVNVTTVDPATAGSTDVQRQSHYDTQARMMHTVIGGNNTWYGAVGGVSYVNTTPTSQTAGTAYHMNWVFSDHYFTLRDLADAITHENGHGLGLYHQGDFDGSTIVDAYSNGKGTGAGSFGPHMGDAGPTQRGLWAHGWDYSTSVGFVTELVNEVAFLDSRPSMTIADPMNRHSVANATPLTAVSGTIDHTVAKGIVTTDPSNATPDPTNLAHYTSDYWSFTTSGGNVTLTARSGRSTITSGIADPGATLDAKLTLFESDGTTVVESTSFVAGELDATINRSLGNGTYFVRVSTTNGDGTGLVDDTYSPTRSFFDMGSYFLTGTIPGLASETVRYWDNAGGSGFGSAGGTWSASTDGRWNTSSVGSGSGAAGVSIASVDAVNFGTDANGLGAGTVTVSGTVTANRMTFGAASGAITLSGGTITMTSVSPTITVNNASATIASTLAGTGGLTKEGTGSLVLTGANTYTGITNINGGTFDVSGVPGGTVSMGSLAGTSGTTLALGANDLVISGATVATTFAGVVSGSGSLSKHYSGQLTLSGANTYSGGTEVHGGTLLATNGSALGASTGTLTVHGGELRIDTAALAVGNLTGTGGTIRRHAATGGTFTLTIGSGNATGGTFGGRIINGAGTLAVTKTGTGTITLTGNNDYTGATRIEGGTLQIGAGGTTGSLRWNNTITNNATLAFNRSDAVAQSQDSNITGTGQVVQMGTGTFTLNGTSSYTGGTVVQAGTLRMADGKASAIGASSGTLTVNGGVFNMGNNTLTVGNLTGAGGTIRGGATGTRTLTFGNGNATGGNFQGVIENGTGTQAITKTGTGTIRLSGNNSYSGATNVNGGSLVIGGSGSINSTNAINVAAGARLVYDSSTPLTLAPVLNGSAGNAAVLSGTGTIGVPLTLNSLDDVLSPGNSPGVQLYDVNQTWNSFTYAWEVNDWNAAGAGTNFDRIDINGSLDLSGSAYGLDLFSLTSLDALGNLANFSEVSRSWTILATTSGISGFLESEWLIDDGGFTAGSAPSGILSLGLANGGNELLLSYAPVPEPSALLLAAMALGAMLELRRTRGRKVEVRKTKTRVGR